MNKLGRNFGSCKNEHEFGTTLIAQVKKRPILYDAEHAGGDKDDAWYNLSVEMGYRQTVAARGKLIPKYLGEDKTKFTGLLKEVWRYMAHDTLGKILRRTPDGETPKTTWPYYKDISWMATFINVGSRRAKVEKKRKRLTSD
ncbi:hypothetical protein AAVH_40143 [Aphelenchoides avenae]|nr:hypothetical protein AAVH_40143 [Aphelenchus avenae]